VSEKVAAPVKVVPVLARACDRVRYGDIEASSILNSAMPQDVPLGEFEYLFQGKWHKAHGSYVSEGEPVVWLELEEVNE